MNVIDRTHIHRRLAKAGIAFVPMLAAAVLLAASPALAARGHAYEKSFGKLGSGAGELKEPWDVAVNEATGDIYVVDHGNNRVEIFNERDEYVGQFNGSGSLAGEGEAAGHGAFKGAGHVYSEIETGLFDEPTQIAVDNSCHYLGLTGKKCEEADPSNGDVYVIDDGHFVIDKYTSSGAYVGQISGSEAGGRFENRGPFGVTVEPDGVVAVSALAHGEITGQRVYFFDDAVHNGTCTACAVSEFEVLHGRVQELLAEGLAVDGAGDVYVHGHNNGSTPDVVREYLAGGEEVGEVAPGGVVSGLAGEVSSGDLYVGLSGEVLRFGGGGGLVEGFGGGGGLGELGGVAVDGVSGTVFVAGRGDGVVDVFGLEPPGAPTIGNVSVSKVTSDSAQVNGELNPKGAATSYRVQYWACASFGSCGAGREGVAPVVEGVTGSDFEVRRLGVAVQGLSPDTTYHFRFVAHNVTEGKENVIESVEGSFGTQPEGGELVLPDGRMWELVSPPDKRGAQIAALGEEGVSEAATDGGAFTFVTSAPTETEPAGDSNGVQVLARRGGGGGWSSQDIATPHESATGKAVGQGQEYRFFSEDLSSGLVEPFGLFDPLSPAASGQTPYVREDFGSGAGGLCGEDCYRPLVTGCPEAGEPCAQPVRELADVSPGTVFSTTGHACEMAKVCGPEAQATSPDLSAVVVQSSSELTPGSAGGLFEWVGGRLYAVGGSVTAGPNAFVAVSDGGTRVAYGQVKRGSRLMLSDPLSRESVQLDRGEGCGGCETGGGEDPIMAGEGSRVFFRDSNALSEHSDKGAGADDLYVCEVPSAKVECELTDLTPKLPSGHADVLGIVAVSKDGGSVYFVADGALATGAVTGDCGAEDESESNECDLYVVSRAGSGWGVPRLVAVLSEADRPDWSPNLTHHPAGTAGEWLAFMSDRSLTGYDNHDAVSGVPDEEVYLYHASGDGSLVCASCDPTGARPDGSEYGKTGRIVDAGRVWTKSRWIAANVPGWTPFTLSQSQYQSRYLSSEGRLFFDSSDALVPQDVDGTEDVYEYEPAGLGSCETESSTFSERAGGCVSLISSGNSSQESGFLDASANGSDVFFLTAAKLSGEDYDNAYDVYDAHECSESAPCPTPTPIPPPPCTTTDACRAAPTPQPSIFGAPSSATFVGEGNVAATTTTTTTTPPPPPVKAKTKVLSRAQRLARALKACRKDRAKGRRAACVKRARGMYGVKIITAKSHGKRSG